MATYGEIVEAIENLPSDRRQDVLLSLVVGLGLAANEYAATKLNNGFATSERETYGRTVKSMEEAFQEACKRAEGTFRRVKCKAGLAAK